MKPIILFFCIALIFSCKNDSNNENSDAGFDTETTSLQGAWKLVSYLNYKENGDIDTILSSLENKQIKMYSDTKVMWSRERASDTLDWFGYGDYTIKDSILTEILDFGSKTMNAIIKDKKEFVYKIIISEDHFSQIQTDSLGAPIYAENYIKLE